MSAPYASLFLPRYFLFLLSLLRRPRRSHADEYGFARACTPAATLYRYDNLESS